MKIRLYIFLSWGLWLFGAQAQPPPLTDTLQQARDKQAAYGSPYLSMRTFLEAVDAEGDLKAAAPLFAHPDYDMEARITMARHLKQVLDGTGTVIYLEEIPQEPNYHDILTDQTRYVLLPDRPNIYLELQAGKWYFPPRAVDEIATWHAQVFPFGMGKLLQLLPLLGHKRFGSFYMWQLAALLVLILLSVLLHKGLTLFSERLLMGVLIKRGYSKIAHEHLLPVARPFSWMLVFLLLRLCLPVLQLPVRFSHYLILAIEVMVPVFFTIMLYHFVDLLHVYLMRWAKKTQSSLDDQLIMLLRKVLKIFVVILGGLFVLDNLHIPIVPLLTGLSLGGLAFALAAQDTIKNFFGSLMIFIDKPFQIGDWITCGDIDGTVEEVGFRSTRVRTFRNSLISVPNAKLADSTVDNHGLRNYRRYYAKICIPYETPVPSIEAFVEGLRGILQAHPDTRKDYHEIHLHDFAREGLMVMFYVFIIAPNWSKELASRHELNMKILQLAEKLDIQFAYGLDIALSTRTIDESYSSKKTLKKPTKADMQKKLNTFFKKKL